MRDQYPLGAAVTLAALEDDLHPVLVRLRAREPISWLPVIDGWLVTGRSTAIEVMRDPGTFTVDDPRFTTGQVVGPSMLTLEGAEHARHREPFVDPYRTGNLGELVAWVDKEARRLLLSIAPAGTAELRTAFAGPLASAAIHRSLGFVGTDPDTMLGWYRAIVGAVSALSAGEDPGSEAAAAMVQVRAAVRATVSSHTDSMLRRLAGGSLDDDELAQNAAILMFGGIETAEGMT
ncbi:MAG: cytochrome P450, partial [Acidimicrobiales bacterium]